MTLSRIVLRLARNPGAHASEPDGHRGYTLIAPIDAEGHLDEQGFVAARERCTVRRFTPDGEAQHGRLTRHGGAWVFRYADGQEAEEPLFRLKDHRFLLGDYVSIHDEDGELLTYRVTETTRLDEQAV